MGCVTWKAILNFPVPTTKKELLRFLGMAGYDREFCPNFASVIAPLTALLKADVEFIWSSPCQEAFEKLEDLLSPAPVLAAPRLDKPSQ